MILLLLLFFLKLVAVDKMFHFKNSYFDFIVAKSIQGTQMGFVF